ncbi:A24 family peptidase [uncultured Clostridium sp.]|uniref:prepilin peptidase n=1 Tax=uncultured Clostridium sp. TaxID=59620 RepID=UPI0026249AA7|nr:A24 family peptidase [uncultured Clostridium sp.]
MKYLLGVMFIVFIVMLVELFVMEEYIGLNDLDETEGDIESNLEKVEVKRKLRMRKISFDKSLLFRVVPILLLNFYNIYKMDNIYIIILYTGILAIMYYLAIIDYKTKYVDNKLFVGLSVFAVASLFIENNVYRSDAMITAIITLGVLAIVSKISKGALGMGDTMILSALGMIYGVRGLTTILMGAGVCVFVFAIFLLIKNYSGNKKKEIPFVPYLFFSLATLIVVGNM